MRLLQISANGDFSLTKDLIGNDTIPPYAILSHTWGADADEVTFEDIKQGTGQNKSGYNKILFCGEQAKKHGLNYFWVDSCCINKTNKAELSLAINSMFRWYRNSTRCYVYLSDVSTSGIDERFDPQSWEPDFRKSKWFTRGWTLQELLASYSVEFFSREHKRLGDKVSLGQQIYETTNIPQAALQGNSLSQFSVEERLRWMEHRETKLEEDKSYSLLGIFNVYILPIYGEGAASAFARLLEEFHKMQGCINGLRLTDPRHDKDRIEDAKGGLLEGLCQWVIENPDFQQWREAQQNCLLWIKGDPGKGKTMLLCGIINELEKTMVKSNNLSYFFCQATDSRINNASAVLRGLLYMLVNQQPSLILHVRKKYDNTGKILFEDTNAWVALSEIFTDVLQDPDLNSTWLVVDALDECLVGLPKLLEFISRMSSVSSRIKWIISSRNWPSIEKDLNTAAQKVRLCLELNDNSISDAVATYIQFKVEWLAKRNKYTINTRDAVQRYFSLNANGTFLWVALVCQEMSNVSGWKAQQKLMAFPPGLDSLYRRMMDQIKDSEDADICKRILAVISAVYRPVSIDELPSLVDMPDEVVGEYEVLSEIIGLCGSFLTLQQRNISFVHQSARDFLLAGASTEIFPSGKEQIHYEIFLRSLEAMSRTLRRDIYGLSALGYPIERVKQPEPDPLVALQYSNIYWVDHLYDWNSETDSQVKGTIENFIREKYVYWLEALSLSRCMSEGVLAIAKLNTLAQVTTTIATLGTAC